MWFLLPRPYKNVDPHKQLNSSLVEFFLIDMVSPLVILLIIYGVTSLATVLVTLSDYINHVGYLDWRGLIYGMREIVIVAFELVWWIIILKAWGILDVEWVAQQTLNLSESTGQVIYLLMLSVALLVAVLYLEGRLTSSLGVTLIAALILNSYYDLGFLGVLIIVGVVILIVGAWVLVSEIHTKIPVKKKKARA